MERREIGKIKTGGRNNRGRVTVRHRGGEHKRRLRRVEEGEVKVERVVYDPNRTAWLGEGEVYGGRKVYKILGGELGGEEKKELIGGIIKEEKIKEMGVGAEVYNVGMREGQRGKYGRAEGTKCIVIKQEEGTTTIRLPSGEVKGVKGESVCIRGSVYGEKRERLEKAGANRRRGIRPTVKGVAMNPVDHPNGGKTAGGGQPKTIWGKLAKWVPTKKARLIRN